MNKKQKKQQNYMKIAGVSVIALVAVVLLVPGLLDSIGSYFTGQVSSCEDTPYNPACTCETGVERKISVPWIGVPRWSCENIEELLIDPESPTFETDALSFVQEYLRRNCGEIALNMSCGEICSATNPSGCHEPEYISAVFGYGSQGARVVNVECVNVNEWDDSGEQCSTHDNCTGSYYACIEGTCKRQKSGTIPWRMQFFVESETDTPTVQEVFVQSNYVYNAALEQSCAHSSYCDYVYANPTQYTIDHPGWCVGDLPLNVVPTDYPMSILGIFDSGLGSGYPSPTG